MRPTCRTSFPQRAARGASSASGRQSVCAASSRHFRLRLRLLKQLWAAPGTVAACYQDSLQAPVVVTGAVKGGTILQTQSLRLLECFTHRFAETLSLRELGPGQDA